MLLCFTARCICGTVGSSVGEEICIHQPRNTCTGFDKPGWQDRLLILFLMRDCRRLRLADVKLPPLILFKSFFYLNCLIYFLVNSNTGCIFQPLGASRHTTKFTYENLKNVLFKLYRVEISEVNRQQ